MNLLNMIWLQMFQNKMKISPPLLPVNLAENLQILQKDVLYLQL